MNKQDLARDLERPCKMIFNQDLARSSRKYLQDQARPSKTNQDQARDFVWISKIKQDWSYSRLSKIKKDQAR